MILKSIKFIAVITVAVLSISCQTSDAEFLGEEAVQVRTTTPAREIPYGSNFRKGTSDTAVKFEIIVKFKKGISERMISAIILKLSCSVKEKVLTNGMKQSGDVNGVIVLSTVEKDLNKVISKLQKQTEVQYAEPNYIQNASSYANDPYTINSQWGMYGSNSVPSNQFGSQASIAWNKNKLGSSTVYVGIIDEGIMVNHEDLAANIGRNPGEIAGNKIDDDGNGLIDDVNGYDFANNDGSVFDGVEDDHGTHVAGVIGAVGGNGKGIAGVVWRIKMLSAKFINASGVGSTVNVIKAIDYFTDLKKRHKLNIVATCNSWGSTKNSMALQDAILRANEAGILFISAVGNSATNIDETPNYPACINAPNIISVSSISSTGALSNFSNFGLNNADLAAPGGNIWSTVPVSSGKGRSVKSGYASYSGTSMAAPFVTGAAALYASQNPGATVTQIKNAILSNTTMTSSLQGKTTTGGRLNLSKF